MTDRATRPPAPGTERDWGPRPVPWGGVGARMRASVGARRLVPTGPALLATDGLARVALRCSDRRRGAARAAVEAVVGGTSAERGLARQARAHAAAQARGWELTWRPWELAALPIRGREHLDRARATGRGLIVSHAHLGPLAGWVALGPLLRPLHHPAGEWATHPPYPGYRGYQVEQRRRLFRDAGIRLLAAEGSALAVFRALRSGGAVLLSMDAPGEHRTEFLGRPVDLDDGAAQLAVRARALVLPAALLPAGRRWELHLFPALDPADFGAADELHRALAGIHEELVLRAPEHLEDPRRLWSRATRDGWLNAAA